MARGHPIALTLLGTGIVALGMATLWAADVPGRLARRRAARSARHFRAGMGYYNTRDHRPAEECFRLALEADPTNREAEQYLLLSQLRIGGRPREPYVSPAALAAQRDALIEQKTIEIERLRCHGDANFEARDHVRAAERYEQVIEQIRWFPYPVDREGRLEAAARARIAELKDRLAGPRVGGARLLP